IEARPGPPGALRDAARAAIAGAARALAASRGPVELEWVATGEAVRFLQLRPYQAPRPAPWSGQAEVAALPGGPWRWDAAHHPLRLSPAQAGLVALADARCRTPFRQRVVRGYLFVAKSDAPPPSSGPVEPSQALANLSSAASARLAAPPATLEEALDIF